MAFDQTTRNNLQNFVSNARTLLTAEFTRQLQNDYGMDPDTGEVSNLDSLTHLNDTQIQTARLLRDTLKHYQTGSSSNDSKEILGRIVREQAFTVLNRLCALRLAEARGILIESIGKGYNSKGFQLYARVAGTSLGETGDTYRNYLFSLFDEFAHDLAVLFDRYSPMGRLFPRESALLELLDKINDVELEALWAEDETIGWIYQYFNSVEERRQMRAESQAPRNSRELAVRNQFFTPRYVVEFLTDNTLGRIWYEMTKGNTALKDQCRYLVRRPNEIFLEKGEEAPEQKDTDADLSQEELLKQPVYIEHRPIKDPRIILMLDPACGSMHFGLYAFDLFEKIYEEAWDLQSTGKWQGIVNKNLGLLTETYATRDELLRDAPRLIIENNIHGVDIAPRAVQIAGLSLWLRAQRSWKEHNIKPGERPQIQKSNIVCAEPMPGDKGLLKEFSESLKPKVLGQLLEIIFEKMELAGEAGSLLKIEEEIEEAVDQAREEFNKEILRRKKEAGYLPGMAPERIQLSLFDFADLPSKTQFWETAEEKILDALRDYAEKTEEGDEGRRRLFVEDAGKGFAFIDICRKRFDVVLMNPPFGSWSIKAKDKISFFYTNGKSDLYSSFIIRATQLGSEKSRIGAITNRTGFFTNQLKEWRTEIIENSLDLYCDLGSGVLDALVEAAAYVITYQGISCTNITSFDLLSDPEKGALLKKLIPQVFKGITNKQLYLPSRVAILKIPGKAFAYSLSSTALNFFIYGKSLSQYELEAQIGLSTKDDFRFLRLVWETPPFDIGIDCRFRLYAKGGEFNRYWSSIHLCVDWYADGDLLHAALCHKYSYLKGNTTWILHPESGYLKPALTYTRRTSKPISVRLLPANCMFSDMGRGIISADDDIPLLYKLIAVLNSSTFWNILEPSLAAGDKAARTYEGGLINSMPFALEKIENDVCSHVNKIVRTSMSLSAFEETDPYFSTTTEGDDEHIRLIYDEIFKLDKKIDIGVAKQYDMYFSSQRVPFDWRDSCNHKVNNLSYLLGITFGRWNIQYATGEKKSPELPDPFDPLPACPPGMLQNFSGLPAKPNDIPDDYPLRITWSGIIVDDEGHPEDIVIRVREAIEIIWKDKASDIEQEACEILNIRSLREYFSKPAKFFADHLKRYSKSRRQAPIYWPLSTLSGSYTLWLYYHRLNDQILYTCVNDFVEPKLKQVSEAADNLRKKIGRTSQEEKELEKYYALELELKDFRDELLRIAKFWKPNLNDGVQITAAPLWKLFQHKPWQKKLKQTWSKLEKGEYDWAHLAYSIWPERVINASHKDRSYAIAHDLEDDLWEGIENGTDRQGNPKYKWVPKDLSDQEIKRIISEKLP